MQLTDAILHARLLKDTNEVLFIIETGAVPGGRGDDGRVRPRRLWGRLLWSVASLTHELNSNRI